MLLPIGTDAFLPHRPRATVGILVVNVALFLLVDPLADRATWILEFGTFRPWQWITSAFSHADLYHLAGNMLFLLTLGQIVEGRLGWWRFIVVYLGMAVFGGMVTQLLMLPAHEGGALGSSGVIFGLLAIALVWPHDYHIRAIVLWRRLVATTAAYAEVSLATFAGFWGGLNVFFAVLGGFQMSTEVLHLVGVLSGILAALALRATDWVFDRDWKETVLWREARRARAEHPERAPAPVFRRSRPPDLPPLELE